MNEFSNEFMNELIGTLWHTVIYCEDPKSSSVEVQSHPRPRRDLFSGQLAERALLLHSVCQ